MRRLLLLAVVVILQVSAPLYMVWHWEDVLKNGQAFRWATAPVDPYDLLRGRYIDLRFQEQKGPLVGDFLMEGRQQAYALLEERSGQVFISGVSAQEPKDKLFVRVKVLYIDNNRIAHVEVPFKRYYMPEHLAPVAEQAYRNSAGKDGVALIRIKDGYGAIEEVYIGDKTIYEYLQTENDGRKSQ